MIYYQYDFTGIDVAQLLAQLDLNAVNYAFSSELLTVDHGIDQALLDLIASYGPRSLAYNIRD